MLQLAWDHHVGVVTSQCMRSLSGFVALLTFLLLYVTVLNIFVLLSGGTILDGWPQPLFENADRFMKYN
jgi:hypothetical protein